MNIFAFVGSRIWHFPSYVILLTLLFVLSDLNAITFRFVAFSHQKKNKRRSLTMNMPMDSTAPSSSCPLLETLHDDSLQYVMSFVEPVELLQNVTRTCRQFHGILQNDAFWFSALTQDEREELWVEKTLLNKTQLRRIAVYSVYKRSSRAEEEDEEAPACLHYGSLLPSRDRARGLRLFGYRACLASTTDHAHEVIEQTLLDSSHDDCHKRIRLSHRRWWSSTQTEDPQSTETLLFTTNCPLAYMQSVSIRPLKTGFSLPTPMVFSWRKTRIRAYRLESRQLPGFNKGKTEGFQVGFPCTTVGGFSMEQMNDSEIIQTLIQDQEPVFETIMKVRNPTNNDTLQYLLPGVVANVVVIDLVGKNHEWPGFGFYAGVERVECDGIPLLANAQDVTTYKVSDRAVSAHDLGRYWD